MELTIITNTDSFGEIQISFEHMWIVLDEMVQDIFIFSLYFLIVCTSENCLQKCTFPDAIFSDNPHSLSYRELRITNIE